MAILDDVKAVFASIGAELHEKKGVYSFEKIIAERKSFLSRKKLVYSGKIKIDETGREIKFTEMLKESGFGLSSGDSDSSTGFGFKKESYNTLSGSREGTIEEQSSLFGKDYKYSFDYGALRKQLEQKAKANGYTFTYKLTSIGF